MGAARAAITEKWRRVREGTLRSGWTDRGPPSSLRHTARHSSCRACRCGCHGEKEAGRKGGDARGVMQPSCGHAAIAAGKARRFEQAAHRPTSWLAPHSTAQAVACTAREGAVREEAAGGGTCRGRQHEPWTRPRHGVGSGECSGGSGGALTWQGRAPRSSARKKGGEARAMLC